MIRRIKSSPIFLLMERREREMEPVVASKAGRGVVWEIVVARRSSNNEVCDDVSYGGGEENWKCTLTL